MPWGLKRFHETGQVHFLTFSCYRRRPNFENDEACATFVSALERVRCDYGLCIYGYVVMPEHIHLLLNEPERNTFAQAIKSLKQGVARRLDGRDKPSPTKLNLLSPVSDKAACMESLIWQAHVDVFRR